MKIILKADADSVYLYKAQIIFISSWNFPPLHLKCKSFMFFSNYSIILLLVGSKLRDSDPLGTDL